MTPNETTKQRSRVRMRTQRQPRMGTQRRHRSARSPAQPQQQQQQHRRQRQLRRWSRPYPGIASTCTLAARDRATTPAQRACPPRRRPSLLPLLLPRPAPLSHRRRVRVTNRSVHIWHSKPRYASHSQLPSARMRRKRANLRRSCENQMRIRCRRIRRASRCHRPSVSRPPIKRQSTVSAHRHLQLPPVRVRAPQLQLRRHPVRPHAWPQPSCNRA